MTSDGPVPPLPTADLADKHIGSLDDALAQPPPSAGAETAEGATTPPPRLRCNAVPRGAFQSYGPLRTFAGRAHIVACFRSNAPVRAALETPGRGRVLVIKPCDPLAALRCAFLGDNLAALVLQNGWAGVVVAGSIRDSQAMREMAGLGVVALGTSPLKSGRVVTPEDAERAGVETAEGVDLRSAAADGSVGAAGWAVVREGDVLYVDDDGFVISDRVLEL